MDDKKLSEILHKLDVPDADDNAKKRAVNMAVSEFQQNYKKNEKNSQGFSLLARLMGINNKNSRRDTMEHKQKKKFMYGGMATAMAVVLIAGVSLTQMQNGVFEGRDESGSAQVARLNAVSFNVDGGQRAPSTEEKIRQVNQKALEEAIAKGSSSIPIPIDPPAGRIPLQKKTEADMAVAGNAASAPAPKEQLARKIAPQSQEFSGLLKNIKPESLIAPMPEPSDVVQPQYRDEGRDKFETFDPNPIMQVAESPVSTFSVDVDTASYSFMRKQINQGRLPAPNSVRVEELINYFDYDYALPETTDVPFRHNVTVTPSPWSAEKELIHIGIKGYEMSGPQPKSNLVFLLDVSGSMNQADKLPLLKNSFKLLLDTLNPDDTVAIAVYAGAAGTVLEPTKVSDKSKIINALDNLRAGGGTAGGAGIKLAYNLAQENFDDEGVNRVILATDGDFNVGMSNHEELKKFVEKKRESGVFLSVLGFGQGNYNDQMMQALAQNGNGVAAYIDSLSEARKVLVEEATSSLFPIAKDVKIQVEFNPDMVSEYRLVGYETRHLNREDFNNDKIDAGDIGAGHKVTAIYEITPKGAKTSVDPLRYGETKKVEDEAADTEFGGEYAFLKMRYKLPNQDTSRLITTPISQNDWAMLKPGECGPAEDCAQSTNDEVRFATAVATFGQKLQGGKYLNDVSYDDIIELAQSGKGKDEFGYRAEFINLVRLTKSLDR